MLNDWLAVTVPMKQFVFDVGANTGYDTYGCAHLLKKSGGDKTCVFAFEPNVANLPELTVPLSWPEYADSDIRVVRKFVSDVDDEDCIRLDTIFKQNQADLYGPGLVKIDIEGAEVKSLRGATELLDIPTMDWLIEIHGASLICEVADFFVARKRPFLLKELTPAPIVGIERRPISTFWLLTLRESQQ